METASGQDLIDAFFQALNLKHLEQCQAQIEALRRVSENEPPYRAWCSYLTGVLVNERDRDWAEGERIFRALLETGLAPDLRGRVLIALGRTYDYQGRWREALDIYQQCLTHFDQPDHALDRAIIWRNMAITLNKTFIRGELDRDTLPQAVTYSRQALLTLEALEIAPPAAAPLETIHWNLSATWSTLGLIYQNLGQWSEAAHCHQRDIALGQSLDDLYGVAAAQHNLGEVLQQQGPDRAPEALQAYLAALKIYHQFHDTYNEIDLLANLGSLHREMGQPEAALDTYRQALDLAESIRARLTAPTTQADYRATIEKLYLAPLSLYLEQGDAALAFTAAERARSRVLADLLAGQEAKPQAEVPAFLLEQRADLRHLLDQAYAADPPPANLPGLEKALADLDRQIELLDPSYAGLATVQPLTAEAVCAHLPPDAALLTYTADDQDRLWILLATPAGVEAKPVEKLTVSWLAGYLTSCLDERRRGGLLPKLPSGHLGAPQLFPSLYRALIEPVWERLQAARTVYLIPFGPLHYLPLGALTPALDQPPPLLAAGRRVVYAPSATILFTYCHPRPPSPYHTTLALAPPDEALQFTVGAARAIAQHTGGTALTGTAATRAAFLAQAGQQRLICFLGHALFDQNHPMSSRLKLADGSLHASDMLRELRLQADLVVLSACETGRSRVLRGDEILGLSRALLYAGTPALLVTLWAVHEIPTRLLVEKLISDLWLPPAFDPAAALAAAQEWLRSLTVAEARRVMSRWAGLSAAATEAHLTQLWQMSHPHSQPQADDRLFSHPFFWSPYILVGDSPAGRSDL